LVTRSWLPKLVFCIIKEVLECSESVRASVDHMLLIYNPLTGQPYC
jgi:hypothetical protein